MWTTEEGLAGVVVGVIAGVEGAVDGGTAAVEARFAGDLDGDPAQDHRRDGHQGADYRRHRRQIKSLFSRSTTPPICGEEVRRSTGRTARYALRSGEGAGDCVGSFLLIGSPR